jgi:DNA mismatch endonuclease, patch repair protein
MTDTLSPRQRSLRMSLVRSKNTKPELIVRRLLHALGYRYRLHVRSLPGSPDLVFPKYRAVVFIHGCFWHMHSCSHGRSTPSNNAIFWRTKRADNVSRGRRAVLKLRRLDWRVLIIWECSLKDPERLKKRLLVFLNK